MWSMSTREGHSYGLWVTMYDGLPVSYNDTFISHGVAKSVIFPWSRSLNTGISFLPLSVGSGGVLNIYWYGALDSHGVAKHTELLVVEELSQWLQ